MPSLQNTIRGCLLGGAVGDALGYTVEFYSEPQIFARFGEGGIREYCPDSVTGKALISDDTQMTLFTAAGLLLCNTRLEQKGIAGNPRVYVAAAYQDWLITQEEPFETGSRKGKCALELMKEPALFHRRAPGNTCLAALAEQRSAKVPFDSYLTYTQNNSKGCGGVMRAAPLGLIFGNVNTDYIVKEGAELAAITHSHPLGYLPAAVLTQIIRRIVFDRREDSLQVIIGDARDTVARLFADNPYTATLTAFINKAMAMAQNGEPDLDNIHRLGEGWVAEETLAIAIYCALRHADDFSSGVIAAVNHQGDSDSTDAVTGNILGAWLGFDAIEEKWKKNLELYDVLLTIADELKCANEKG